MMKRWICLFAGVTLLAVGCTAPQQKSAERDRARVSADTDVVPPVLLAAVSDDLGQVTVLWRAPKKNPASSAYWLYRRSSDNEFKRWKKFNPNTVTDAIQSESILDLQPGETWFFQMTSVSGRQESVPGGVLAVRLGTENEKILVVNDSYPKQNRTIADYADSLDRLDRSFDSCLSKALLLKDVDQVTLDDYEYVLWTCGLDSRNTFTPAEQELVKSYLNRAKGLFVCGTGIGKELAGPQSSEESKNFLQFYLKSYSDPAWKDVPEHSSRLIGSSADDYFKDVQVQFDRTGADSVLQPSRLEPFGGSNVALFYDEVKGASAAAIAYVGMYDEIQQFARMVHMALPWECLSTADERTECLAAILEYLKEAGPLRGLGFAEGKVIDIRTGEGIPDVQIVPLGATDYSNRPIRTRTREGGAFKMVALEGTYHLVFEKPGYQQKVVHNVCLKMGSKAYVFVEMTAE